MKREFVGHAGGGQQVEIACGVIEVAAILETSTQPADPVAIRVALCSAVVHWGPQECRLSADAIEVMASGSASPACGPAFPDQQTSGQPSSNVLEALLGASPILFLGAPHVKLVQTAVQADLPDNAQGNASPVHAGPGPAHQTHADIELPHLAIDLALGTVLPLARIIRVLHPPPASASQHSSSGATMCPGKPANISNTSANAAADKRKRPCSSVGLMSLRVLSVTGQLLHGPAVVPSTQMDCRSSAAAGLAFWASFLELKLETSMPKVCSTQYYPLAHQSWKGCLSACHLVICRLLVIAIMY